jgi:hypothetical protein
LRQIAYAEKQFISYFRIFGTYKKEVVRIFLWGHGSYTLGLIKYEPYVDHG